MEGYQRVNEIDLIDLMFYCLKRWRGIVICMILFATFAGVYKYQVTVEENQMKREEQIKQDIAKPIDEETQIESEPIVIENPISSAISSAIIGLFSGMFLVCFVHCMKYIMSGKLQNINNFQEKYGMDLLGVVRESESSKKIFRFMDRWICRLEEGPNMKIEREEQIKIAAVNVQAAIHRNTEREIRRIMLVGTVACDDVIEICQKLIKEIEETTFSPYKQIIFYATDLKKLENYEGVIFIEKKGKSYEKLIRQERKLALDRNVNILGTIVC